MDNFSFMWSKSNLHHCQSALHEEINRRINALRRDNACNAGPRKMRAAWGDRTFAAGRQNRCNLSNYKLEMVKENGGQSGKTPCGRSRAA